MPVKAKSTFVYGRFVWPKKSTIPYVGSYGDFAVEILREYSSAEFLGKLYARIDSLGEWSPLSPSKVSIYDWYKWFSGKQEHLYFAMDGSGYWEVVNFRNESDENGPYVAVALKYRPQSSLPKWVVSNPV